MENLNFDINLKYIRKTSRKIIKNKYLTYFVALFTIFHISESLINSDNTTFVKLLFQNNILKVLVFMLVVIIGYFNMTLGFLLLLNFIFVINIPQKVEGFANSLPNLIDKNEILKYQNNFVSNEPTELKYKSNEEMSKEINEKEKISESVNKEKKIQKEFTKNEKTNKITINNPINLKDSEKLEEITDKIKKNKDSNNNDSDTNSDTDIDDKSSLNLRKQKLREELEKLEKDEKEIKDLKDNNDDTIESDIKEKELDKRLRLAAMKDEDDESSSSSSNSSGSSSSSDSSEDSDKDYDEVSINDARDHVMKKLRNKLKRKYVKGK